MKYSSPIAYSILYRDYNDIDIYVEDSSLLGMYERIFKTQLGDRYKIETVVALGPKASVISEARRLQSDPSRKRLFIVDGDYDWLHNSRRKIKDFYELELYSVENFIFDDEAIIDLAGKIQPHLTIAQIRDVLSPEEIDSDLDKLLPLMQTYALARSFKSRALTVKFSIDRLMDDKKQNLDLLKISARNREVYRGLCRECGWKKVRQRRLKIEAKVNKTRHINRRIVAGKYYGVNLLLRKFQKKLGFRGNREHFICSLIEASSFHLDPKFQKRLRSL